MSVISLAIELSPECQQRVTTLLGQHVNPYYSVEIEKISTVQGEVKMKLTNLYTICQGRITGQEREEQS